MNIVCAIYHIAQTWECNMIYCEGQYSCNNPFISINILCLKHFLYKYCVFYYIQVEYWTTSNIHIWTSAIISILSVWGGGEVESTWAHNWDCISCSIWLLSIPVGCTFIAGHIWLHFVDVHWHWIYS